MRLVVSRRGHMKGIKVLSLFDGISCGMVALERAGIKVERYVAFEIDEYAIKVSEKNYPSIERRGDVTKADFTEFKGFDLVIGGSPCQDMSSLRHLKDRKEGLNGKKSSLFVEYARAIEEVEPRFFLLENIIPTKEEDKNTITEYMGVKPVFINSADFSAQNRPRLYWTNIEIAEYQKSCEVVTDILEEAAVFTKNYPNWLMTKWGDKTRLQILHSCHGKASCLTASMYKGQKPSYTKNEKEEIHKFTPMECERLQTLPDNYTDCVSNTQRYKTIGNGWTVDVIAHIFKGLHKEGY